MSFLDKATTTTTASVSDTPPDSLSGGGETKSLTAGACPVASPPATSTSAFGSNKPLSFGDFTSPPVQTVGSSGFGSPQTTITTEKLGVMGITNSGLEVTTSGLGISTSTTTSGISLTGGLSFDKTIADTIPITTPSGITALRISTGVMTATTARDMTPAATPEMGPSVKGRKQTGPSNATPELTSPVKARKRAGSSKGQPEHSKKSRCSLYCTDTDNILNDSGSDDKEDKNFFSNIEDDAEGDNLTEYKVCINQIMDSEDEEVKECINQNMDSEDEEVKEETEAEQDESVMNEITDEVNEASERSTAYASVDTDFSWSKDFSSFAGQKEVYLRVPGPTFSSQDPVHVFQAIWDQEIMETIVRETNLYAWQTIAQLSDPDIGAEIPSYLDEWTDVTVGELYRYFAILILFSFCYRSNIREYWNTGILGMSDFRQIMSLTRFQLISDFLHFVSNENLLTKGHDRKIEKITPIVDHCNRKFAALYTPSQHLNLDESLLLWKSRLSLKQCIRSQTALFGTKIFELCEAVTGYLLQFRLYTGKRFEMHPDAVHKFQVHTSNIVLDLIGEYLDVGHVLVMDNWYNQLPLTRYLKSRHTDVLGTIKHQRRGLPYAIRNLDPNAMKRGKSVGRHSGDISLVAWKDVRLVTVISTYHQHLMVSARRAGEEFQRPIAVEDYNKYMGGVDLKDRELSMFLMEPKRPQKWYMKVFKKLLNISLLNAYIIYSRNPMPQVLSHRDFRYKVAEGLLSDTDSKFWGHPKGHKKAAFFPSSDRKTLPYLHGTCLLEPKREIND